MSESQTQRATPAAVAAVAAATVLGGLVPNFAKWATAEWPPFLLGTLRFCLAATGTLLTHRLVLGPVHLRGLLATHRRGILGAAFFGIFLNQAFFLTAMKLTSPAHMGFIYGLNPVFVLVLSPFLGKRRVPARMEALAVAFATLGAVLVMASGALHTHTEVTREGWRFLLGDALGVLAVLCWSVYILVNQPVAMAVGAMRANAAVFSLGAVMLLPFGLWDGLRWMRDGGFGDLSLRGWTGFLFLGICASWIGYLLTFFALKKWEATTVSAWLNFAPALSMLFSIFLFGFKETLNPLFYAGAASSLTGMAIAYAAIAARRPTP